MKISVNANGCITLYEIYNEIELVSKDEVLLICERDGHFDILRQEKPESPPALAVG